MKRFSLICMLLITLLAEAVSVGAFSEVDYVNIDATTQEFVLQGKLSAEAAASYFNQPTLTLWKPGTNLADIPTMTDEQRVAQLAHSAQITPEADGTFTYRFRMSGQSGSYLLRVTLPGGETIYETPLYFATQEEVDSALAAINGIDPSGETAQADMRAALLAGIDILGLRFDLYETLTEADATQAFLDPVASAMLTKIPFSDPNAAAQAFRAEVAAQCFGSGITAETAGEIIGRYHTELGLDALTPYTKTYCEMLTETQRAAVHALLAEKTVENAAAFSAQFGETVIMSAIDQNPLWSSIKRIVTDNEAYLTAEADFSFTAYHALDEEEQKQVWKDISNDVENVTTLTALRSLFDSEVDNAGETQDPGQRPGGSTGGSTGGSSSGGNRGTSSYIPPNTDPIPSAIPQTDLNAFPDLEDVSWAWESINALHEQGVISGREDGNFHPNDAVTREEFVKMIVTAFSLQGEDTELTFQDVSADAWYYPYISTAVSQGIVNGINETTFGVGENITREDMAVIAYRAAVNAGKTFVPSGVLSYVDTPQISEYAVDSVAALTTNHIINGLDTATFGPQETATRAQAAKILYGLLQQP